MDCVELEKLCKAALQKMGLGLVLVERHLRISAKFEGWNVCTLQSKNRHSTWVEYMWKDTMRRSAHAYSIEEVANMLFNLYDKEWGFPYWKTFVCVV